MNKSKQKIFIAAFALISSYGVTAVLQGVCSKLYSVTGNVTELSIDSITISQGAEKFELSRADLKNQNFERLKKGDKVSVIYSLQAQKVINPQEAGEARPGEIAPQFDLHMIQDDRTFWNAKCLDQPKGEKSEI